MNAVAVSMSSQRSTVDVSTPSACERRLVGGEIVRADRGAEQRMLAEQRHRVRDVRRGAAATPLETVDEERDVEHVRLLGEDVVAEPPLEHHDGVEGDGSGHGDASHGRGRIASPARSAYVERRQWPGWRCTSWDRRRRRPAPFASRMARAIPAADETAARSTPSRCITGRTRRSCAAAARRSSGCSSTRTGDGLEPASARRLGRSWTSAPSSTPSGGLPDAIFRARRGGDGPVGGGVRAARLPPVQRVDRGQRPGPAPPLVRRRRRDPRRADRERLRRRRPDPDDGRAADRVEEAARCAPRRRHRAHRAGDACGHRDRVRRARGRLAAAARDLGRELRRRGSRRSRSARWRCACACSAARRSATRG